MEPAANSQSAGPLP
jgi:Histone methylation protein DOT1